MMMRNQDMTKTKKKADSKKPAYLKNMPEYTKASEPVKMITANEMDKKRIDRLKSWVTFYRNNPSFFVEHYMMIRLLPYQGYWINLMAKSTEFLGVASRASAKSWLIAVYSIARCILYPGTITAIS